MHCGRTPSSSAFEFNGRSLLLNQVLGEEVEDPDDPRLSQEERESLLDVLDKKTAGHAVLELLAPDPRCVVKESANSGSISLSSLNHDPSGLRSALLTSFDLVDDVDWLCTELRLPKEASMTFCMHHWIGKHDEERKKMLDDFHAAFNDVVVHFPGELEFRRAFPKHFSGWRIDGDRSVLDFASTCSVHAKLLMFEYDDRLRIAITSANLKRVHWSFRGEVVWVQDFPRVQVNEINGGQSSAFLSSDVARLLDAGQFAKSLVHFVSDLLINSSGERRHCWVRKLASFDLSGASARLVLSLPGLFVPSRSLKPNEITLRLHAEAAIGCGSYSLVLERSRAHTWELHAKHSKTLRCVGRLLPASAAALNAACSLGLEVSQDVEVLPTGTEDIKKCYNCWEGGDRFVEESHSFVRSLHHSAHSLVKRWWSYLFPPRETLVIRAVVSGDCRGKWVDDVADFASCMDINYGLFSLREYLGTEAWLEGEESEYAAITGSITWPNDDWLQKFDYFIGRTPLESCSGPTVVVPVESVPIEPAHEEYYRRGQLCAHSPPRHARGREFIYNHSKVLVRKFWDAHHDMSYGWIYAGSHNLTKAAWGELFGGEEDPERLWVGNRELGVLLLQPRVTTNDEPSIVHSDCIFENAHLPFGFPLIPADIKGREVHEWPNEEEEVEGWWWQSPEGVWIWRSSSWNGWGWQQDDESDDDWEPCRDRDWRMRASSWWWWTPN